MASQIDVIFNADTGRYVANINAATGAVSKSAEGVAAAKNKILEAMEAQVKKATELGASQQNLQRITEKAASQMSAVTEQNANRIIYNLDRIAERNKQVAGELANLKVPKVADHEEGLSNKQASSAILRGGGLRAAENVFASVIPEAALQTAGFAFGVTALATVLFDMGEKGVEAFEKVRHATELAHDAFEDAHDKSRILIDDKELENQKIQNQIDKISGHPNNGLATALLEAKKMADQLAGSLQEDRKQLAELFKQTEVGTFGRALQAFGIGAQSTVPQEKNLLDDSTNLKRDVRGYRDEYTAALAAAPDDKSRDEVTKKFNKRFADRIDYNTGNYTREIGRLKQEQVDSEKPTEGGDFGENTAIDNSGKIQQLEDRVEQLKSLKEAGLLDASIYAGQKQLGQLKQDKANEPADEKKSKADEAQRKQWESEDAARKIAGTDSLQVETKTWADRLAGLKAGSDQYLFAQREYAEKLQELRRFDAEQAKQADTQFQKQQREGWDIQHADWAAASHRTADDESIYWTLKTFEATAGSENYRMAVQKADVAERQAEQEKDAADKARSKASLAKGQQQTSYQEAVLGIQKMTGQISQQDAALQLANIHAEQYRQKMAELNAELGRETKIDPDSAGTVNAQAAVDKAAADRRVQVQQDAAAQAATTWEGALKNANAVWVQDAEDSAKQVVELWQQAFSGLNSNLESLMVGEKTNFGGMFKGISKTLGGDALKHVEAPIMKAFGVGKPDGSAANPLWVKMVGGLGSAGSSLKDFFSGGKGSGGGDLTEDGGAPAAKGIGGFFGSLFGSLIGGHRALGGRVSPGVSYDVGEMGREEFVPDTPGTIVPHNQTGSGNAANYTINVPNGVTPEAMHMFVQDSLKQFHGTVVRSSVQAMQDHNARRPASTK